MIRLTLPVKYDPARMQYAAYCHECKAVVALWTAEWCMRRQTNPPIGFQHDCPELTTTATITPYFYEPTTKENK